MAERVDAHRPGTGLSSLSGFISDKLVERIERGEYPEGSAMPSEHDLAREFGATRFVVRAALDDLAVMGRIRRVQGKGTYVTSRRFEEVGEVGGFRESARTSNRAASVRVLSRSRRLAGPYFSRIFSIDEADVLYSIRRLNSVDGEPLSIERALVPLALFEGIEEVDVSVFSLYETYKMYGREVVATGERLDIETLSAHDAALLQVEPGELALSLACLSFDATGCVVEYSNSLCRADRGSYSYEY